ncbi:MAG: rRNA pseudouridine synthase [Alphaproteobacteria bacterium]|nr:rRNA pseudouridine synthase [Alphaproteobacteria bacterium]
MTDDASPTDDKGERIAKLMARAGLCSRRDAERWIAEGRVTVDGRVIDTPAVLIADPGSVRVDGQPLPQTQAARLWLFHKPAGLVTTHKDEQGRSTVFDQLPKSLPRVISVGRLDLNSEGLLLLTNDGGLARELELPSNTWIRTYRVRVFGLVSDAALAALKTGVEVEGVRYGAIDAKVEKRTGRNAWLLVSLTEGKNREIRRVMEHLGLKVSRLIRIHYGPFDLGDLARGEVREVSRRHLLDQLGGQLKAASGGEENISKRGWAKAKPKANVKTKPKPKPQDKTRTPRKGPPKTQGRGPGPKKTR